MGNEFFIDGRSRPLPSQYPSAGYNQITPDYFRTMGTRLLAGRVFSDADQAGTPAVVIINQAMARRFWPGENPIGHRIRLVGDNSTPDPPAQRFWRSGFLLVRAEGKVLGWEEAVRREIREIDPSVALSTFRTMNDQISGSIDRPRLLTFLLGSFALLALTLAAVGVYGVVSYSVSQRTREFGIRMALGAQRGDIFKLVVGNEFLMVLVGVIFGLLAALALSQFLTSLLFGVASTDALTYSTVVIVLSAAALAACYIPSRRATKVDPMIALRYE